MVGETKEKTVVCTFLIKFEFKTFVIWKRMCGVDTSCMSKVLSFMEKFTC